MTIQHHPRTTQDADFAGSKHFGEDVMAMLAATCISSARHAEVAAKLQAQDMTPRSLHKGLGKRGKESVMNQLTSAGLSLGHAGEIVDAFFE